MDVAGDGTANPRLPMHSPRLSVVMPVLDGGKPFERVIAAIAASNFRDFEWIVVDDGSRDDSAALARAANATVVLTGARASGPAAARNRGAAIAQHEILCFIDADCEVHPDTLGRIAAVFENEPGLTALFGSYDDEPAAPGFFAQYKNLLHHFTHQTGRSEASTFWAGCGAIRREAFLQLGGFDAGRYARPSIEDIELGYRVIDAGGSIRLDPTILVKHHKAWTLRSLLVCDIRDRALPWSRLMLGRKKLTNDLNVDARGRVSAVAAGLLVAALCAAPFNAFALLAAVPAVAVLLVLNRPLYAFLLRVRGPWFLLRALPLHWFYFLYSAASFVMAAAMTVTGRFTSRRVSHAEAKRHP